MSFTSLSFILFLTVVFVLYYIIPKRFQWMLLLGASYFFYARAGLVLPVFLITTTASTYWVSRKLDALHRERDSYLKEHRDELDREQKKVYKASIKKKQWRWLLLCLFFNFGVLAVFKYTNFTIANLNSLISLTGTGFRLSFVNLVLPMGISFYIFQTMGYIIDVYRGKYPAERNPFKLALFVSFFPQLIQGPISRFDDLAKTLYQEHSFEWKTVSYGIQRILWGFFKKLVIADRLLVGVNTLIHDPEQYQGAFVVVGMVLYAAELYADFTGGIDITIGIAETMGIRVQENFFRPYFSKNIEEYWRRWHITMGTWFKDYLFYPFSVCEPMRRFSKWSRNRLGETLGRRLPVYAATLLTWFVTGFWHGASWNFIVWGVMNGVVILASQECSPLYERFHKRFHVDGKWGYRAFCVVRTFFLMCSLRLFDCYRDVGTAFRMFGTIFTKWNWGELFNGSLLELGMSGTDFIIAGAGILVLFAVSMLQRSGKVRDKLAKKPMILRLGACYVLLLAILVFGAYGIGYDASQFIYNQF